MTNDQDLVLIIDTSGEEVFVALIKGGDVMSEKTWKNSPDVGRRVLSVVDELLKKVDLKLKDVGRVAVQVGPGRYYSSLRAGVTVANMLAYAVGIEVAQLTEKDKNDLIREASVAKSEKMVLPKYARRP